MLWLRVQLYQGISQVTRTSLLWTNIAGLHAVLKISVPLSTCAVTLFSYCEILRNKHKQFQTQVLPGHTEQLGHSSDLADYEGPAPTSKDTELDLTHVTEHVSAVLRKVSRFCVTIEGDNSCYQKGGRHVKQKLKSWTNEVL